MLLFPSEVEHEVKEQLTDNERVTIAFNIIHKDDALECYKTYLAMKQHFTKDSYDYLKYCGIFKASPAAFNKRKDRYFFERMSRQKNDKEIEQFLLLTLLVVMIHSVFTWQTS